MKNKKKNELIYPSIVGSYILAHSGRIMNRFVKEIDGFGLKKVYYTDTDSLFIDGNSLEILKNKGFYGNDFGQGKNDLNKIIEKDGKKITISPEINRAIFLGPKMKFLELKYENETYFEMTFKGIPNANRMSVLSFENVKNLLENIENPEMKIGIDMKNSLKRDIEKGISTVDLFRSISANGYL